MKMLRKIREDQGFSQRELATKSGISFRCVQQLEEPDHNWRVSSMQQVAQGLNLPSGGLNYYVTHYFSLMPDSIEDISLRMQQERFESWKIHLFDFVDRFRHDRDPRLVDGAPVKDLKIHLQALIASTVEMLCDELDFRVPPWCQGIPTLDKPWFVSGTENLKAMALIESPTYFRARNIFVLDNFLSRV